MLLRRARRHLAHRRRAAAYGIPFSRPKSLAIPHSLVLDGTRHDIDLPDNVGSVVTVYEVLLDDCYGLDRMCEVRTILDVGANSGLFCLAARRRFPGAVIHAYEPDPDLYRHLERQAAIAGATWFPEAIGVHGGNVRLMRDPGSPAPRAEVYDDGEGRQISLREALERLGGRADLVKIDIEGGEHELFADREAWSPVRYVALEYHGGRDAMLALLRAAGFAVVEHEVAGENGVILAERSAG